MNPPLSQLHGQALADVGDETAPVVGDVIGLLSALAIDGGKTLSAALQAWEEDHHHLRDDHKEAVYALIVREKRELERLEEIFRPACRLRMGA